MRESPSEKQLVAPKFTLVIYRARYYDPQTGEFVSRDPLEYVDGMSQYRGYFAPNGKDPNGTIDWGRWGGCLSNRSGGKLIVAKYDDDIPGWVYSEIPDGDDSANADDVDFVWIGGSWCKINQRNDILRGGSLSSKCCLAPTAKGAVVSLFWQCCWSEVVPAVGIGCRSGGHQKVVHRCRTKPYVCRTIAPSEQPNGGNAPGPNLPLHPEWGQ